MLRYIKVNGTWIDTLSELRDNHICYIIINNKVMNAETDELIGDLQDERDSKEN